MEHRRYIAGQPVFRGVGLEGVAVEADEAAPKNSKPEVPPFALQHVPDL